MRLHYLGITQGIASRLYKWKSCLTHFFVYLSKVTLCNDEGLPIDKVIWQMNAATDVMLVICMSQGCLMVHVPYRHPAAAGRWWEVVWCSNCLSYCWCQSTLPPPRTSRQSCR